MGSDEKFLRGRPTFRFSGAASSLPELDTTLVKSNISPSLLLVLLLTDSLLTCLPFFLGLSTVSIFDDDACIILVDDIIGEVSGEAKATILRGLPGDLFTGAPRSLSELDVILLTLTNLASLLGVNRFETFALPFRFVVVEVVGDILGEVSGDAKAIILRGLPGDLFTGVTGLLSELDAILLALNNLPLLLGVNRLEIVVLSFRFAVVELEAFERDVVFFLRALGVLSAGKIMVEGDFSLRRGLPGLLFIGVTMSLSELEAILSKSNDSPSLLSVTVALPFCILGLRRLVDDRLRLEGDLLRLLGVASESSIISSSSVTNISSLAMSGCWGPLRSAGGRRR